MKKTTATIAAVAFVAMTGIFAQNGKAKKSPDQKAPEQKEPPKIELPAEADVKAYHDAQIQGLKILLDAQVKAGIITQAWADAKLAILKAVQADCKGFCIVHKGTDIPFGGPALKGPDGRRPDCRGPREFDQKEGRKRFDGQGPRRPDERPDFDQPRERREKFRNGGAPAETPAE